MALRRVFSKLHSLRAPWNEGLQRDPFNYPLRTIEQVREEYRSNPPRQQATLEVTECVESPDHPKGAVIKLTLNMEDWNLTPLQRERLIFLLGPRYRNSPYFRVIVRNYATKEENLQRATEILTELYLESKRAP